MCYFFFLLVDLPLNQPPKRGGHAYDLPALFVGKRACCFWPTVLQEEWAGKSFYCRQNKYRAQKLFLGLNSVILSPPDCRKTSDRNQFCNFDTGRLFSRHLFWMKQGKSTAKMGAGIYSVIFDRKLLQKKGLRINWAIISETIVSMTVCCSVDNLKSLGRSQAWPPPAPQKKDMHMIYWKSFFLQNWGGR